MAAFPRAVAHFSSLGEHGSLLRRYLYPTMVVGIYFREFEKTRLCQLQVFVLSSVHVCLFVLLADYLFSYVLCMYLTKRTKSYNYYVIEIIFVCILYSIRIVC